MPNISRLRLFTSTSDKKESSRKNLLVKSKIQTDLGYVKADPGQFHQIIYNLCLNAVQAMGDQPGLLDIRLDCCKPDKEFRAANESLSECDECVCLTVTDTGPGIPPEHRDRLYEPFFTTKPVGEGTGLGLAVVHGIVTAHGGVIHLDSTLGKGTTFKVFIPRHTGEAEPYQDVESEPIRGNQHILLVDDEKELTEVMVRHLKSLGYRIDAFSSSDEAYEHFQRDPGQYDILLTDQVMPEMTGIDLIRKIREIVPKQPVVLMTGFSKSIDREKIEGFTNLELIMKPYSLSELTHAIQRLVKQDRVAT